MTTLLLTALLLASTSPADRIAAMLQALGGEEAIASLQSLSVAAACSGPDGDFRTEVRSLPGSRVWFRQTTGDEVTEIWSTPDSTWTRGADGERRALPAEVRSFVRAHEFHLSLLEADRRYADLRMGTSAVIREVDCVSIDMVDESGQPATLHLSRETSMPIMLEINAEGAAGPIRTYFQDWRWIDGLQLFGAFEMTEGDDRNFRYDYETIEVNPGREAEPEGF